MVLKREGAYLEIKKLSGDLNNKEIFLCGPPVFMESMREQLIQLGVKKNNIHWEKFNF
jgi:ferredoxin-NADP reductase